MIIESTILPEVKVIIPEVFSDERGYFLETYQKNKFIENKIPHHFYQDNEVKSKKHTIRGLHYQIKNPQGKIVRAVLGKILDVAVDIRLGSPNFGKAVSIILTEKNKKMLYIPEGFAHGYGVLSEESIVVYKCTNIYDMKNEQGIIWNDPNININWEIDNPLLSSKDKLLPKLSEQNILPKLK
ncbi:dTDP-4-dehydrorhamnose 3,5-epimerase [Candidatus Marinimicrobia bacterium]|nr:dTDP-4-dehydrorhamnose 3,5-epimerase [Candidatus Neomarinimicrobiota bacterium]